jgi:hypothetical protein
MNYKGVHMTDEDKGQPDQKTFMQKHKNVYVLQMWQEALNETYSFDLLTVAL